MGKLTALSVKSIKTLGLHSDGDCLFLRVQKSKDPNQPAKSWILRWGAGQGGSMGLGSLKHVSLAQARELAAENLKLVHSGQDPKKAKKQKKALAEAASNVVTFRQAAAIYIESKRGGWKNVKHAQQWENTIEQYADEVIGHLPCSEITTDHLLTILRPIWTTKNETATRLRGRIESILNWAKASGYRTGDNVANWKNNLTNFLPTISKRRRTKHHPAMPYPELPEFLKSIRAYPSRSAKALMIGILTGGRTQEILEAEWSEFNWDSKIWTIPKDRMKKDKEHRVPLSTQLIEILTSIPETENSPWVFTGRSRKTGEFKAFSNMAMLNFLQKTAGLKQYTVHGFRSSFRDWAAETTDHKREVIEQALAHQLADQAEAAYQRGDYMEKRKKLMQDWADYCYNTNLNEESESS
jgi:integrase